MLRTEKFSDLKILLIIWQSDFMGKLKCQILSNNNEFIKKRAILHKFINLSFRVKMLLFND